MVNSCFFSFIIPVYNAEKYLYRCVNSIYSQSIDLSSFEIIAINDGSTDGSLSILKEFERQYQNFRIVNKKNEGVSKARNEGILIATGTYLVFVDADDAICDEALERVFDFLLNSNQPDFLETVQVRILTTSNQSKRVPHLLKDVEYSGVSAFENGHIRTNAGGAIVRRQFLYDNDLLFPEGLRNGEDSVFFANAQVYAKSIVFYDIEFYCVYLVPNSASRNSLSKRAFDLCETVNYAQSLRHRLVLTEREAGLIEYLIYQMLSNTVYCFIKSKQFHLRDLKGRINLKEILPINVSNMHLAKNKARLMNHSFDVFYFLSWCVSLL